MKKKNITIKPVSHTVAGKNDGQCFHAQSTGSLDQSRFEQLARTFAQDEIVAKNHILKARQEAEEQTAALIAIYSDRENQHHGELRAMRETLLHHMDEAATREKTLTQLINQSDKELKDLLHSLVCKEREFGEKLSATLHTAADEKRELIRLHSEQDKFRQHEYLRREESLRNEHAALLTTLATREKEFGEQMRTQQRQFKDVLAFQQQQCEQIRQTAATVEAHLNEQIQAERQIVEQFKHSLTILQVEISDIHSSSWWRIIAPLRKMSRLFTRSDSPAAYKSREPLASSSKQNTLDSPVDTIESTNNIPVGRSFMTNFTHTNKAAQNLDELLSLHDEPFVHCAYISLLGRNPDSQGMEYYLDRLRKGFSKESIIVQLVKSKEAQQIDHKLMGVDDLLRKEKNLLKLIFFIISSWFGWHQNQQQLNRLENMVGRLESKFYHMDTDIRHKIGKVEQAVATLQVMPFLPVGMPIEKTFASPPPSVEPQPDLSHLTHHAQTIFKQLKNPPSLNKEQGRDV